LAHELKTPISVISSNMDVLKYGFDEKIVEKSKQELKHMIKIID
jgi:signal transduction histidine kinase